MRWMRTGTEGSFAVPMFASIQGDTAPLLARGAGGDGDRSDGEAVSRPAASAWFASVAPRSRVAAAMALLLLALVALVGSDSGLRAAALGSGAGFAARGHGDPAGRVHHRVGGRGSWRGRAGFRDDDVVVDPGPNVLSTSSILRNNPGPIPGLVEHVDAVSGAVKFRLVSFCNRAYWPFLHVALQSVRAVAPDVASYWTVIVPDEGTAEFIRDKASDVDVFVDDNLRDIVSAKFAGKLPGSTDGEERAELRRLMSWRRVHVMHGLLDAGYTAVFIEPDVVFARDPTNVFDDVLRRADVAVGSDYGTGASARKRANTKVIVAKPTAAAKALFAEWQGAEDDDEQINRGSKRETERAYLLRRMLSRRDPVRGGSAGSAVIEVLDETDGLSSYLSHPAGDELDDEDADGARLGGGGGSTSDQNAVIVTGGGCDDVNYKLNWLNQAVLRYALPAGPEGRKPLDFDAVRAGCDEATRSRAMRERVRRGGKRRRRKGSRGDDDE